MCEPFLISQRGEFVLELVVVGHGLQRLIAEVVPAPHVREPRAASVTFVCVFQSLLDLTEEDAGLVADDTIWVIVQEAPNEPGDAVSLLSVVLGGPGVVQQVGKVSEQLPEVLSGGVGSLPEHAVPVIGGRGVRH